MTTTSASGSIGSTTKILVVDDNEDAATLLADFLSTRGYDVKTAFTSADAIALAPGFDFQVAILDLGLPEMDGYELARRLRVEDCCTGGCSFRRAWGQPASLFCARDLPARLSRMCRPG